MEAFYILFMTGLALLFGLIFVLFGVLLVGTGLAALRETAAAFRWPQVVAVIDSNDVEQVRFKGAKFKPVVTYSYSTATGTFSSRRTGFAERLYATEAEARRMAERYPAATTVMARCNPENPAEAVLEIRWSDGMTILFFGLLCWIFPVGAATAAGVPWPVSASVLAVLLLIPAVLLVCQQRKLQRGRSEGWYPAPGCGSDEQIIALMARGEKGLAIRLYRELHGGGLKEARLAVEERWRMQGPSG